MNKEVVKEIANLMLSRSGQVHMKMVDLKYDLSVQAMDVALKLMILHLIRNAAKREGISFERYIKRQGDVAFDS